MKATEIQYGDYLSYNGQIIKVSSITKKKVGYHIKENECRMHYLRLSECKPIPLTPEILEKNGFERSKVFVEWKYENDDVYMIYKPFPYLKIQTEECIVAFPCEYIHQLQHALRLCGIEKEIEL